MAAIRREEGDRISDEMGDHEALDERPGM